jgi:hypothetical protein
VSPIFAGLQAGIGLLSLFRENVQFTGAKTSVDQRALQFSVASSLTTRGIAVRLHETEIPPPDSPGSALRTELLEVEQARARAAETVAPHVTRLIDAQARLESAAAVPDNTAAVQVAAQDLTRIRQQMAPLTDALEHADAQLTALRTQLGQTDGTSGLMALGRLLRAERLQADASHYLQVRVVSSGGHHRVSRNLWRMILTGDGVSALGGVVVRWALLDPQGRFLAGGILDERRTAKFPNTWLAPE